MSASTMPTSSPRARSASARLTVSDDLPTPPLPDATAITRVRSSTAIWRSPSVRPPCSCSRNAARCASSMCVNPTVTSADAGHGADVHPHLRLEVRLERAAGNREADRDVHVLAVDVDRVDHAELDDIAPQLGVDDLRERGLERVGGGARHDGMLPGMLWRTRVRADAKQGGDPRHALLVAGGDDARATDEIERRGGERRPAHPAAPPRRRPRAPRAAPRRCRSSAPRSGAGSRRRRRARRPGGRARAPASRARARARPRRAARRPRGARCSGRVASSATSCSRASGRDEPSAAPSTVAPPPRRAIHSSPLPRS